MGYEKSMKSTDTAELFERCRSSTIRVKLIREKIQEMEHDAAFLEQLSRLNNQPNSADQMQQEAGLIHQYVRELIQSIDESISLMKKTEQLISTLPTQQALIMRAYYLNALPTWKHAAWAVHISESHCYELRAAALAALAESNERAAAAEL